VAGTSGNTATRLSLNTTRPLIFFDEIELTAVLLLSIV